MRKLLAVLGILGFLAVMLPIASLYVVEGEGGRLHRIFAEMQKE